MNRSVKSSKPSPPKKRSSESSPSKSKTNPAPSSRKWKSFCTFAGKTKPPLEGFPRDLSQSIGCCHASLHRCTVHTQLEACDEDAISHSVACSAGRFDSHARVSSQRAKA